MLAFRTTPIVSTYQQRLALVKQPDQNTLILTANDDGFEPVLRMKVSLVDAH